MKFEKSAGAIVFREVSAEVPGSRQYLLLSHLSMGQQKKVLWDFPKGLMIEGEVERACAQREVEEETGLAEFVLLEGFRETLKVFFKYQGQFINKTVVYFLAQATSSEVHLSIEHSDFAWLGFVETSELLTFKNSQRLLSRAEDFLNGVVAEGHQIGFKL